MLRIANILRKVFLSVAFLGAVLLLSACATQELSPDPSALPTLESPAAFDGARAYQDVATQLEFGPRTLGSEGHDQVVAWMQTELSDAGWDVSLQTAPYNDYTIQNVVAKRGQGQPWIILGAHYDTRFWADQDLDPDNRQQPVPGANDGASGIAVLMELARVLPDDLNGQVWLVFFDAEDNGHIDDWDWILGSRAFAESLEEKPDAVVVADMIGDADLQIYWEMNSNPELTRQIWRVADSLGYADHFISQPKYRMLDDHTPFLEAGIPAVDLIDFDYPSWHTVGDTLDKVSAQSLQMVGDVLLQWLLTELSMEPTP